MDIISLIIIITIIKKVLKIGKEKNKNERKPNKNTSGDWWQQKVSDYVETASQQRAREYANTSAKQSARGYANTSAEQRARGYGNTLAQQRATKERLERKYGRVDSQTSYTKTSVPKQDILTRAKANVKEEAPDNFKQQAHAEVCAEYRSHAETAPDLKAHQSHSPECDYEGDSDIIKRVNDLIVMGYDGAMKFDRDFIAEGVEMLNSFNL